MHSPSTDDMTGRQGLASSLLGLRTRSTRMGGSRIGFGAMMAVVKGAGRDDDVAAVVTKSVKCQVSNAAPQLTPKFWMARARSRPAELQSSCKSRVQGLVVTARPRPQHLDDV